MKRSRCQTSLILHPSLIRLQMFAVSGSVCPRGLAALSVIGPSQSALNQSLLIRRHQEFAVYNQELDFFYAESHLRVFASPPDRHFRAKAEVLHDSASVRVPQQLVRLARGGESDGCTWAGAAFRAHTLRFSAASTMAGPRWRMLSHLTVFQRVRIPAVVKLIGSLRWNVLG